MSYTKKDDGLQYLSLLAVTAVLPLDQWIQLAPDHCVRSVKVFNKEQQQALTYLSHCW